MKRSVFSAAALAALAWLLPGPASAQNAQPLTGPIGQASGPGWQSSWMTLDPPMDFRRGDRLRVAVEGPAKLVCIRLLPREASPDTAAGLVATRLSVPAGGALEVELKEDHLSVKQVSVHGGSACWGTQLGIGNGDVRLSSVGLLRSRAR